jgi:hypothetical protein
MSKSETGLVLRHNRIDANGITRSLGLSALEVMIALIEGVQVTIDHCDITVTDDRVTIHGNLGVSEAWVDDARKLLGQEPKP